MSKQGRYIAVRAFSPDRPQAMRWATFRHGVASPREISGAAFIGTLYELCGLLAGNRYRFSGSIGDTHGGRIIEFELTEPEIIAPEGVLYPSEWKNRFGEDYYDYINSLIGVGTTGRETQFFYNAHPDIRPTSPETLSAEISALLHIMRNPEAEHGTSSGQPL